MAVNEGNVTQESANLHPSNIKKEIAHAILKGVSHAAENIVDDVVAGIKATEMAAGDQNIKNSPHPLETAKSTTSAIGNNVLHPAGDMNPQHAPHPVDNINSAVNDGVTKLKMAGPAAAIIGTAEAMGEQAVYFAVPGGEQRAALHMAEEGAAKIAAHRAIDKATTSALRRENPIKEALDSSDGHIDTASGLKVYELQKFNQWNKDQAGTRAAFYKQLFNEQPELAAAMYHIDPEMRRLHELILSPENDHLIGITPYQGYQAPRTTYGYTKEKAQAEQWGIEWKEGSGILNAFKGGELAANKAFFDAKKSVEAAREIALSLHQDAALRLINPERPMDPELQVLAAKILHAKPVDGALSSESRQALPKELQNIPVTELAKLQAKTAASLPENLRLSVAPQTNALTSDSAAYASNGAVADVAAHATDTNTQQQFNQLRTDFLHSVLKPAQQDPVAEITRLSAQEVAVQQKTDDFIKTPNAAQKAVNIVVGTVNSHLGNGYNLSELERLALEKAFAKSDYAGFVALAKNAGSKGVGVLAMAGSAAAIGPAGPAAIAGAVLVKEALKQYELDKKIALALQPALDNIHYQTATVVSNLKSSATNYMDQAYQRLVQHLPKDTQGNLTPQSAQVLMAVDKNIIECSSTESYTAPTQFDGP